MEQEKIHVYSPEVAKTSIRILPKYKRRFIAELFDDIRAAIDYGIQNFPEGCRIFRQNCFEWYGPDNILLVQIKDVRKEKHVL